MWTDRTPTVRRAVLGLALAGLCVPAVAGVAQTVRGVVRDSTQQIAVAGAIVVAIDSAGRTGARAIADGQGQFTIAPGPRTALLHVIRIGYTPRDVPVPRGDTSMIISMMKLPPLLDAVRVTDRELCPGSTDRGSAFQLLDQARAGLLAAVVAREASTAAVTTLVFQRSLAPSDGLVREMTVSEHTEATTRPFIASASPETFVARGYMTEDATGRAFYAPDADVLLDPSFGTTHCFHVQSADAAHRDQIGVAFSPIGGRDSIVEVSGVIWMNRLSPSLASLEFRYVGLEPVAARRADIGGHLEFQTAANGVSFVERWSLRIPVLQQFRSNRAVPTAPTPPGRRQDRSDLDVTEIREAGGQLLSAAWKDGVAWHTEPAAIVGRVTDRGTTQAISGAVVTVAGDTTTTDRDGVFSVKPLIAGRYELTISDTTLGAFARARRESRVLDVGRDSNAALNIQLAPLSQTIAQICKNRPQIDNGATLSGKATFADGKVPRDAEIRVTWPAEPSVGASNAPVRNVESRASLDDRGRFVVCGAARSRRVSLHLESAQGAADTSFYVPDVPYVAFEWTATTTAAIAGARGTITGVVVRDGGAARIPNADVSISSLSRSTTTDAAGNFEISNVPPGMYALQIRHIGHGLTSDTVTVAPGMHVRRTIALARATSLDTVRAVAEQRRHISPALTAFDERRKAGFGHFIVDSVLRNNDGRQLADFLTLQVPGTRIFRTASADYLETTRLGTMHTVLIDGKPVQSCFPNIYLDGVLIYEFPRPDPPSMRSFAVDQLGGVEFYAGGATTPPQFRSGDCGTLLLWTKER